jgi:virginiamycin B lyase
VIVTEYDLPRKEAMPHDVIVDAEGKAWYSDFGNQFVGVLDPKTGAVKDIATPVLKPEQPKGGLDLEFDPQGNIWLSMMYQAGISRVDAKTHEVKAYPFPKEWQSASTQASMVSPQHSDVDGKVWSNNQEDHYGYRLDVASGQWENFGQAKDPGGRQIRAYGMPSDLQNNVYQLGFSATHIGLQGRRRRLGPYLGDTNRVVAAAARPGGRAEPAVVRRIRRKRHRHVRSQGRSHQGMEAADAVERAL